MSSLEGGETIRVSSKETCLKQLAKCGLDRRCHRKIGKGDMIQVTSRKYKKGAGSMFPMYGYNACIDSSTFPCSPGLDALIVID